MRTLLDDSLIPGTFNARDLGGLVAGEGAVRRGVLIRSDAPIELGDVGRRTIGELGIRTAIDLRETVERDAKPADFDGLGIETVHRPLLGDIAVHADPGLDKVYTSLLDARGEAFAATVSAVADAASEPVIFFCSAGKDRTGLTTAMLLSLLGVGDEDIVADYHRTEANMQGAFRQRIQQAAVASGLTEQQIAVNLGAPRQLMRDVLGRLASEGGAEGYLRRHGLQESSIQTLRRRLREP